MGSDDIQALIGSAFGAGASGGHTATASRLRSATAEADAARRSEHYQRLLREEAAGLKALYAQGQAGAHIGATTASVTTVHLPWMQEKERAEFLTGERMRQLNEEKYESKEPQSTEVSREAGVAVEAAQTEVVFPYRPLELEAHEDFAVRLAARPKQE